MFYRQTDVRWKNEIMTESKGRWTDRLGRYGCLTTSAGNVVNCVSIDEFTPKDMNDAIKEIDGYEYLLNRDTPVSRASFLVWDKVKEYLSASFDITNYLKESEYIEEENAYYIARVVHPATGGGHYINILTKKSNMYICFDVEDGFVKPYKPSEITLLHKMQYRGD